ncbi:MAG: DUF4340 domain-containing protein [Bacteroidota bacterium]
MNKQVKILLILVVAALAVYFLYTRKPWSSVKGGDETAFAIEDTASITKVFLADGRGSNTLLQRTAKGWTVDDKFAADGRKINMLLETIHDVRLRNPVGQAEYNNVLKTFAASGVKVELYHEEELVKTIYVGQMTSDQTGTYMMIDGASAPYVTHIPGFVGYLTPRFLTQPVKWRSRLVFDKSPEELAKIEVVYPGEPSQSFSIENNNGITVLKDAGGNTVQVKDTNFIKYYVAGFSQLHGEGFDEIYNAARQDSISHMQPYVTVTIYGKDGQKQFVQLHLKAMEKGTKERYDEAGNLRTTDNERYFAFANGDKNLLYVQQYNFGRVLRRLSDFRGR